MQGCLLSIDNGLTGIKAVLFDTDGRELACTSLPTAVDTHGEISEIDMDNLWDRTADTVRNLLDDSGIDAGEIAGIANSGHGAGIYPVDAALRSVRKAVTSMDTRASAWLKQWEADGLDDCAYELLHQHFWSAQSLPLMAWLKRYEPENYQKTAAFLYAKDWIIARLTGKTGTDYTDASNAGLINLSDRSFAAELFDRCDLGDVVGKIPEPRNCTDIIGCITAAAAERTGLRVGTPVCGGLFDCAANVVGSGAEAFGGYVVVAGTWNINASINADLRPALRSTKCSLYPENDKYLYVESSATSAVNLEWFIQRVIQGLVPLDLAVGELYETINARVNAVPPEDNEVIYLPFLYVSEFTGNLRAGFQGIRPEYDVGHLLQAIYEGICFAHRMHIENLRAAGITRACAVLSGGAAKSPVWCRMFADVLGMDIVTIEADEVAALGSAICLSTGLGRFASIRDAAARMVHMKQRYAPDPGRMEIYDMKYERFIRAVRSQGMLYRNGDVRE